MHIHNVHEREIAAPAAAVGALVDGLGRPGDTLWPSPAWDPMVLDRPVGLGAAGGHAGLRYRVTGHEPGRRVVFTADPGQGIDGTHAFTVEPLGPDRSLLRHELDGEVSGRMLVLWPLVVGAAHDAVVEAILDRAEAALGVGPAVPSRLTPFARLLRRAGAPRAVATAVPSTPLLAAALPRVDFADAHAVATRPGMPTDPQVWADAVFRDPPAWVAALLGLRQLLVGFVGIERGSSASFATLTRTADEVLLGEDAGHLSFRASVLCEPDRTVVSTVVTLNNLRGRAYFVPVRLLHPVVVRAMLTRAGARLASRVSAVGTRPTSAERSAPAGAPVS